MSCTPSGKRVPEGYGRLTLYLIENQGQVDACVNNYLQGRGATVYFTTEGTSFIVTTGAVQS